MLGDLENMGADWYAQRGFTSEMIRRARTWYLQFLPEPGDLLDVGCGRGEFLDAASDANHQVTGVDHDPSMIAAAGHLKIHESNVLDYLQTTPKLYDAITAFHVIEHLEIRDASAFIQLAADRLRPGGRLIIATQNPGSLPTIAHEFWRDPTHVRPYDLELIEYLTNTSGLTTESAAVNPESERGLPVNLDDLSLSSIPKVLASQDEESVVSRWVAGRLASSSYGKNLERTLHETTDSLLHTRQELDRIAGLLRRFLEVAYEPSEIYVVAQHR